MKQQRRGGAAAQQRGGKVKDQTKDKVFIKLTSKLSVSLLSKHRIEKNRSGLKRRAWRWQEAVFHAQETDLRAALALWSDQVTHRRWPGFESALGHSLGAYKLKSQLSHDHRICFLIVIFRSITTSSCRQSVLEFCVVLSETVCKQRQSHFMWTSSSSSLWILNCNSRETATLVGPSEPPGAASVRCLNRLSHIPLSLHVTSVQCCY